MSISKSKRGRPSTVSGSAMPDDIDDLKTPAEMGKLVESMLTKQQAALKQIFEKEKHAMMQKAFDEQFPEYTKKKQEEGNEVVAKARQESIRILEEAKKVVAQAREEAEWLMESSEKARKEKDAAAEKKKRKYTDLVCSSIFGVTPANEGHDGSTKRLAVGSGENN